MPRVECFTLEGVELVFHSADHAPPHFHAVRRGEFNYRVFILAPKESMLEVKHERKPMSGATRRHLCVLVERYRGALLEEYSRKVNTRD